MPGSIAHLPDKRASRFEFERVVRLECVDRRVLRDDEIRVRTLAVSIEHNRLYRLLALARQRHYLAHNLVV